jgi:hypothetical protein
VPPNPPTAGSLPDFASPGFRCVIFVGGTTTIGWIQTAIDQSPDHVAKPPEKGLPGSWITVVLMSGGGVATWAWVPTPPTPPSPPDGGGDRPPPSQLPVDPDPAHRKAKHSS